MHIRHADVGTRDGRCVNPRRRCRGGDLSSLDACFLLDPRTTRQGESLPKQQWAMGGSLAGEPTIDSRRGTSRTVIEAMRRAAERQQAGNPLGTRTEPINDSKGSAAVVRVAASGFGYELAAAFESGCDIAALTHGHPSGWLAAGTFSAIIFGLYQQRSLREALAHAQHELRRQRHHEEVSGALTDAITLADKGSPTAESLESLGRGWTAPEALAMAVYAALTVDAAGGREPEIVRRGLLLAVNHSGDSDATGALCGSLLGARYGVQGLPLAWADRSEAAGTIYKLARDYCIETGPHPPGDGYGGVARYWSTRYLA
jgi:ADP-ribosylglycohydrolase